jgi:hypothetical protein
MERPDDEKKGQHFVRVDQSVAIANDPMYEPDAENSLDGVKQAHERGANQNTGPRHVSITELDNREGKRREGYDEPETAAQDK